MTVCNRRNHIFFWTLISIVQISFPKQAGQPHLCIWPPHTFQRLLQHDWSPYQWWASSVWPTKLNPHSRLDLRGDKSVQYQLLCLRRLSSVGGNHKLCSWLAQEKERQVKKKRNERKRNQNVVRLRKEGSSDEAVASWKGKSCTSNMNESPKRGFRPVNNMVLIINQFSAIQCSEALFEEQISTLHLGVLTLIIQFLGDLCTFSVLWNSSNEN